MERFSLGLAGILLLYAATAQAEIKTEVLTYKVGDVEMTGYLAYDDAITGKRPGVLVVHEWWGQNDYARRRAEMLAEEGYTALALDMYGDGKVADHPDTAQGFMQAIVSNMPEAERRFAAAQALLAAQPTVDKDRIAAIGYCFGGGIVLHMARAGMDLDGVVSFHGGLGTQTPAKPGTVKARVLVFTGAADPMAPPEQVNSFEEEMTRAGVDYRVVSYPGAKHGFTNPEADELGKRFDMPLAYDRAADMDSWEQTRAFLASVFREPQAKP
ncbi:MAG: dienelactone hydrolase family protein [Gammaproteobacteria bacterium]|nr:dienelactone hydrolase family protein [Gammaproteobacteria bacterium]